MIIKKIISGGQTGVDRAALDFAIEFKIPHGGYCPANRRAEDGKINLKYQLIELGTESYKKRTLKNVLSSDGTLILHAGIICNGTALTQEYCKKNNKNMITLNILDLTESSHINFGRWFIDNSIKILNIAGPRESKIFSYKMASKALYNIFNVKDSIR